MSKSIIKKQQQTGLIAVRTIQNFGKVLAESRRDSYESKVKCLSIEQEAQSGNGNKISLRREWNSSNNMHLAAKRECALLILDGITTITRFKQDEQNTILSTFEEYWNVKELAKEAVYGEKNRILTLKQSSTAKEFYNEGQYQKALSLLILDTCEWFNVSKGMTTNQITRVSEELMKKFGHLNMLDIALSMRAIKDKALPNKEDNVFDRIEPAHFIKAAEWYDNRKTEEIVELQNRKHEKYQGDNNYNAIIKEHEQYENKQIRKRLKGWEDKLSDQKRSTEKGN